MVIALNEIIIPFLLLLTGINYLIALFQMIFLFVPIFPLKINRIHYLYRVKFLILSIMFEIIILVVFDFLNFNSLFIIVINLPVLIITKKVHPENFFKTIIHFDIEKYIGDSIVPLDSHVIVVKNNNITRAYPLSYVSLHHVIHDSNLLVTFCPLCNSANVFDQSNVMSTYKVSSLEKGNMIIIDKKTKTYWQQATGETILGPLHHKDNPLSLELYDFDIMSLRMAIESFPKLEIVKIKKSDLNFLPKLQRFLFPKLRKQSKSLGYRNNNSDDRLKPFTRVLGFTKDDKNYALKIKEDIKSGTSINYSDNNLLIISGSFINKIFTHDLIKPNFSINNENKLILEDKSTNKWNFFGESVGKGNNLKKIHFEDVFWFHWTSLHKDTIILEGK